MLSRTRLRALTAVAAAATVTFKVDEGWPRSYVSELGSGEIWFGRDADRQKYDAIRIAAHEFGHIFGLPDQRSASVRTCAAGPWSRSGGP